MRDRFPGLLASRLWGWRSGLRRFDLRQSRQQILSCLQISCLLAASLIAPSPIEAEQPLPLPVVPGRFTFELESDGYHRTAQILVPSAFKPETKLPLVLILHGAGGNPEQILDRNHWATKAEQAGFIAVAPAGLPAMPRMESNFRRNPNVWNSGQLADRSFRATIDDVAFIRRLLDALREKLHYDPERVFVTGHSNGGGMTYRLANELSPRLCAIATVAGQVAIDAPRPARPVPTLSIYGTRDPLMPENGGESQLPWGKRTTEPVAVYLSRWAVGMNCAAEPVTRSDKQGVKRNEYPSKRADGPTLTVLILEGHGHQWPGARPSPFPETLTGPVRTQLNATDVIWSFFEESARQQDSARRDSVRKGPAPAKPAP